MATKKKDEEAQGAKPVEKTLEEIGAEYFAGNPNCIHDHVLITKDGVVFYPTLVGSNHAMNHAISIGQDLLNEPIKKVSKN